MASPAISSPTPERRAREYETIYIMRSAVSTEEAKRINDRAREVIDSLGGVLLRVDNWGRRKLAYPIAKSSRGVFVYLRYAGFNDLVAELERNLRLLENVVRYQTVQLAPRVDIAALTADPEELKFAELEAAPEDDEPELAQRLGLVERPRHDSREEREGSGGGGGDGDAEAAEDGPKAADDSGEESTPAAAAEASENQ